MTTHDDPEHRAYHQPDPDRIEVRDSDSDGVFTVRMPLASTGEVRNDGDKPLTRDEVSGMAQQVNDGTVGVFLDHGANLDVSGSRYSATGKVGEWQAAELVQNDAGETLLEAEARLMDPETMPDAAGSVREALAALKSQVERDIALASSIGWRQDDSFPGGNDLMEGSIVGIPADPRTTQEAAAAMARAASDARPDADPEELVDAFRAVVMAPEEHTEGGDARDTVTDDGTTQSGDEPDDTNTESDGMDEQAHREFMREQEETQTEILRTLADTLREDGDGEDDDEEDDEEEDDDGEQSSDEPEDTQSVEVDGEELTAEDVRELREAAADADPEQPDETPDEEQDADDAEDQSATNTADKYGLGGPL